MYTPVSENSKYYFISYDSKALMREDLPEEVLPITIIGTSSVLNVRHFSNS